MHSQGAHGRALRRSLGRRQGLVAAADGTATAPPRQILVIVGGPAAAGGGTGGGADRPVLASIGTIPDRAAPAPSLVVMEVVCEGVFIVGLLIQLAVRILMQDVRDYLLGGDWDAGGHLQCVQDEVHLALYTVSRGGGGGGDISTRDDGGVDAVLSSCIQFSVQRVP